MALIDKGALFNALANAQDKGDIFAIIQDFPAVDAVAVVRCKDCRYYDDADDIGWCKIHTRYINAYGDWNAFNPEDFCSHAARKDTGEENARTD